MIITPEQRAGALDLLAFIDASPSPWHAADEMARRLESQGFSRLHETEAWRLQPGARRAAPARDEANRHPLQRTLQ